MENFSGQLKKYKVTINDLLEENKKLEARAKASEQGKMKDRMERATLKANYTISAISLTVSAGSAGAGETATTVHDKGQVIDISRNFRRPLCGIVP